MIIHVKGDVIELKGSLVENHWLALKSAVSLLLKQHPNGVIIDGGKLTEINEAGADTFLEASNYIQAQHARVVVTGLSDHILEKIRQMPGARSQLPLAASVEEARASLAVGGAEAVPEIRRKPAVLVPLLGAWPEGIEFAAVQAAKKAEIHLLYVIEVPRALPLGVPLPEKEQEATRVLSEAEAALAPRGARVRKLTTRSRVAIEGAGKFIAEAAPRLAVVAYPKSGLVETIGRHDAVSILCAEAPNQAVVLCVGEAAGAEARKPTVLVPLTGVWPAAIEFAEVHAAPRKAELHLLYLLRVPRTLPLDASLPDEEQAAQQTLAEAEGMLKRKGIVVRKLTARVRDVAEGAARFAADANPELVVLAYLKQELTEEGFRHDIVHTFCHDSPCDVAIYCVEE